MNPYWKDGGTGIPDDDPNKKSMSSSSVAGDGGVSWLRKAYQRCVERAKEEGVPLEDVAAEQYGVSGTVVIFYLYTSSYQN